MSEEFKTPKARAERCVTHHHACDCREYKFQELEAQLAALREAVLAAMRCYAVDGYVNWERVAALLESSDEFN